MGITSGYGYGYGSGSGSGDGYGYGYGDGYGDGDGYGRAFGEAILEGYARDGCRVAFWRSNRDGTPANGGTDNIQRRIGHVDICEGPLELCSNRALHGTLEPWKWNGDRLWVVALRGEVAEDGGKPGALTREIIDEIVPNPFVSWSVD